MAVVTPFTPQCPNGGQVVGGAPSSFWAYDAPWFSYLLNHIPGLALLLSPFVQPELIVTSDFCASEPVIPPAPAFTDYVNAFLTNAEAQQAIVQYWKAMYLSSIWTTYCQ